MKSKNLFLKKTGAAIVDCGTILLLSSVLARLVSLLVFPQRWICIALVGLAYYIISYCFSRRTIGQMAFGIQLTSKSDFQITFWQIAIREITKCICVVVIPALILQNISVDIIDYYPQKTRRFSLYLLVFAVICICLRQTPWNWLAKTSKDTFAGHTPRKIIVPFISIALVGLGSLLFFMMYNNIGNPADKYICGFKFPYKHLEYPTNKNVTPYINCLNQQEQTPKDYILDLFKQYDIVVLEECSHAQQHEWDLIDSIVASDYFIRNVGHVFTEYGNSIDQPVIDSFLNTHYDNEESLEHSIASTTHIMTDSYFDFLKFANLLNCSLPDSLKISLHACDVNQWKYFTPQHQSYDSIEWRTNNRDSLMAQVVIDWYSRNHQKCLVVTNYRHAFAANRNWQHSHKESAAYHHFHNQAQYIYDAFPTQFANVLYFGGPPAVAPLQFAKGKWNTAYKQTGYRPVGFSLAGTVFGKEHFDMFRFTQDVQETMLYQDIFTGIIFNQPENRYVEPDYYCDAFISEAARLEYEQLVADSIIQNGDKIYSCSSPPSKLRTIEELCQFYQNTSKNGPLRNFAIPYLASTWWHYCDIIVAFLFWFLSIFIILIKLLLSIVSKSRAQ